MNGTVTVIRNKQICRSFYAYLTPSISQAFFIIILLVLSLYRGQSLLSDFDIGWHIRVGEQILKTFSVPRYDSFSFITPQKQWLAHEWLSEVVMALIHKYYGLTGLVVFFSFLIALFYSLLFKMIQARTHNSILNLLIVLLVISASKFHWLARPHIFSLGLTIVFYFVLREFYGGRKNYVAALPLLTVFWVNLHGGFIIGPILIFIYLGAIGADIYKSDDLERTSNIKKAKQLCLIASICMIAAFINPYGYDLILYPFKVVSGKIYTDNIAEFLSPNFHTIEALPFEILFISTILIPALSRRGLNLLEVCLIALFAHMSLVSSRYILLFGVIVAPILAEHSQVFLDSKNNGLVNYIKKKAGEFSDIDRVAKGYILIVGAVSIVLLMTMNGKIAYSFDKDKGPVEALEFLKKEHVPGRMFNQEIFGEYTIYAAQGKYKVFIDDRFDMYGDQQFKDYLRAITISQGWNEVFDKYSINWIFFSNNSALSRALLISRDWHLIYSDKVANIFVRNIPDNQYLISKYANVKAAPIEEAEN